MKRTDLIKWWVFILVIFLMSSCNEFFLEDINDEQVDILSPVDGTVTEIVTPVFWWGKVKGASNYRLQIVTPSFESAEALLRDTLVEGDKYEETLYPGDFEWRVRAENSEYETVWSYAKMTILDSDDLTRQSVKLRNPLEGQFLKVSDVEFKWDTLSIADYYEIRIYKGNWEQTLVVDSLGIKGNTLSIELTEGKYTWGIKALNEKSESLFSYQTFILDNTPPVKPELNSPGNEAVLTEATVDFEWSSNDPQWDVVFDSLFVFEVVSADESVLYHKDRYDDKTATIELDQGKQYSWKVKSVDQVGNESAFSESFTFTIN